MHRRKILYFFLAAAATLFVVQGTGLALNAQYPIEWLFTPSHFIGGMCVMFAALYAAAGVHFRMPLALGLALVAIVGGAWEAWEVSLHLAPLLIDTTTDLIADLAGGYAAYKLAIRYA